MSQSNEQLKNFVRAAFHLRETARYVIDGETFGRDELMAALTEFEMITLKERGTMTPTDPYFVTIFVKGDGESETLAKPSPVLEANSDARQLPKRWIGSPIICHSITELSKQNFGAETKSSSIGKWTTAIPANLFLSSSGDTCAGCVPSPFKSRPDLPGGGF